MSRLYGPNHRALQDRFDMRRLADDVFEKRVLVTEITAEHKAFVESRDMFWLATIDHEMLTVSYKGGEPGFVRVLDGTTLAFPCYDGNGMFYSMGNLVGNDKVGLLFLNFERPHRIRVQGIASVDDDDPLLAEYSEAQLVVRVAVTEIFPQLSALRAPLPQGRRIRIRAASEIAGAAGGLETRRRRASFAGFAGPTRPHPGSPPDGPGRTCRSATMSPPCAGHNLSDRPDQRMLRQSESGRQYSRSRRTSPHPGSGGGVRIRCARCPAARPGRPARPPPRRAGPGSACQSQSTSGDI